MLKKALAALLLVNVMAAVPMLPRLIDGLDGASIGAFTSAWVVQMGEATGGFLDEAATSRVVFEGETPTVGGVDAREIDLLEHEVGRALTDDEWLQGLLDGESTSALEALENGTFGTAPTECDASGAPATAGGGRAMTLRGRSDGCLEWLPGYAAN